MTNNEEPERPIISKRFLTTGLVIAIMLNVALIYLAARDGSPVLVANLVAIGICCVGLWFVRRYTK